MQVNFGGSWTARASRYRARGDFESNLEAPSARVEDDLPAQLSRYRSHNAKSRAAGSQGIEMRRHTSAVVFDLNRQVSLLQK